MDLKCPRCGATTSELLECDVCKTIGCIKCIIKHSRQWVCDKCKDSGYAESPESALSAMFG